MHPSEHAIQNLGWSGHAEVLQPMQCCGNHLEGLLKLQVEDVLEGLEMCR